MDQNKLCMVAELPNGGSSRSLLGFEPSFSCVLSAAVAFCLEHFEVRSIVLSGGFELS